MFSLDQPIMTGAYRELLSYKPEQLPSSSSDTQGTLTPGSLATPPTSSSDSYFELQEPSPTTFGAAAHYMLCPPFLEMYSTSSSSAVEAFDAVAPGFIEQLDPCDPCRAILEDPSAASLRAPLSEVLLGTQTGHFPLVDPPLDMTDQSWCRPDYGALFADLPLLAFRSNTPMNPAGRSVSATALGHNSTAFTGGISSRVSTTNDVVGEPITVLSQSRSWLRCSSCMRTFPDYDAIREHEKRHHVDDHKHHCFFCPRGFTRNDVRRRHIKSQHRREAAALFQKRRA